MKRLLYLSFWVLSSIKHRIVRRFTPGGYLVIGGLAASAVVGLDTNKTMAFQAFTFLLSLGIISITASLFFRYRFSIARMLPRFGTAGEKLSYRIVIENKSGKAQKGLYLIENMEDPRPDFETFLNSYEPGEEHRNVFDRLMGFYRWLWLISIKQQALVKEHPLQVLSPNGKEDVSVEVIPLRRGYLRLTGVTIACPDPLGLFKSLTVIPEHQSVLILPKRYSLPHIRLPGSRKYQTGGVALASSVGDSEEFVSLRDYRPGDPVRRIHWKSWAKTGKPIVKEYQDEFFVRHALVLDTFQNAEQSDILEEAVSVAASFACTIETLESLLDLMFVGAEAYCFTAGRGLGHTENILEILASVKACRDKNFSVLLSSVLERAAMFSGCICILLSWDDDRKQFISRLKELGTPVLVFVITDEENVDAINPGPMQDTPDNFYILQVGKIQEGLSGHR